MGNKPINAVLFNVQVSADGEKTYISMLKRFLRANEYPLPIAVGWLHGITMYRDEERCACWWALYEIDYII